MRGAKRKQRDADRLLRELGYRYVDEDSRRCSDGGPEVHSARSRTGGPEAVSGSSTAAAELAADDPDIERGNAT